MKALVIYDSVFGNTEKIAQAVGNALGTAKTARVVCVADASPALFEGVDLLVVASPTRGFRPMEEITKFLKELPDGALDGMKVAAFDTRMDMKNIKPKILRFFLSKGGYANKAIAKLLVAKGGQLLEPTEGFFVDESEGPLTQGELERAEEWAKTLISA